MSKELPTSNLVVRLRQLALDIANEEPIGNITVLDAASAIERLRAALKDTLIWLKAAHVCKDWVWDVEQWNAAEGVIEDARKLLNEAAPAVETCTCGNGSIPGPAHHPTCSAYFEPARPGETTAEQGLVGGYLSESDDQ